jgi:glyceraldehyde-3-phosphate dehydrogenase/erythrose-4-phosphate dehydrogenase
MKIKIAIAGYGNLGKGVECAIRQNDDMELYGIFSRRNPESVKTLTNAKVYHIDNILNHKDNIDVLAGIPIAGICVVSAIMKADDPKTAAEELKARAQELGLC